jgi:Zn-dependent protease
MSVITIVISLFVLLFAITVHEASHAWAAKKMGDFTAASLGRVSLNPLAHIDPFGTIILPLILVLFRFPAFGWAKPVPVNPYNLRNPRRDNLWISIAGPTANFLVAGVSLLVILILKFLNPNIKAFLQSFLVGPSGLPRGFYPLEGLALILFYAILINLYLGVFNLIPVPPLDGSGVILGLLSSEAAQRYERIRPYGFLIIIGLIYLGVLNLIIRPIEFIILTMIFF